MTTPPKIIDALFLEPPEPLVRALEAIDTLQPGEELLFIVGREPFPLYNILDQAGLLRETEVREDGAYQVRIRAPG